MHKAVLLKETLDYLAIKQDGIYVDATFGGGETAQNIATALSGSGKLMALDLDMEAIQRAQILKKKFPQILPIQGNFKDLLKILQELRIKKVDGIIADLGISNFQLQDPDRGFSIEKLGILDMRMDQNSPNTAIDILRKYSEKDLVRIFRELGEQPFSQRIARAIKKAKKLETTEDFLQIIQEAIPGNLRFKAKKIAINLFRAIRMEVNQEIPNLKIFIPQAIQVLKTQGRLVIISFHSLEDRIVKWAFRDYPKAQIKILTPKPIFPTEEEIQSNPKSRSAKLRACEKI